MTYLQSDLGPTAGKRRYLSLDDLARRLPWIGHRSALTPEKLAHRKQTWLEFSIRVFTEKLEKLVRGSSM